MDIYSVTAIEGFPPDLYVVNILAECNGQFVTTWFREDTTPLPTIKPRSGSLIVKLLQLIREANIEVFDTMEEAESQFVANRDHLINRMPICIEGYRNERKS
jgi:hypothetical protein